MAQNKNHTLSEVDLKDGIAKITTMLTSLNQLRASVSEFYQLEDLLIGDNADVVVAKIKGALDNIRRRIEGLDSMAIEAEQPLIEAQKLGLVRKWDAEKLFKSELLSRDDAKTDDRPRDAATQFLDPEAARAHVAESLRRNAERALSYLSNATVHRVKRPYEDEDEDEGGVAKKIRMALAMSEDGRAKSPEPVQSLEDLVDEWLASRRFPDVDVRVSRIKGGEGDGAAGLAGSVTCVKVSVTRVMNVFADVQYDPVSDSVAFNKLAVFGWKEEKNIWQDSDHFVFQRITQLATETLDRFATMDGREALICFLDWLASHRNLFAVTCRACGKHLYYDSPQFKYLPPTVRSWRGMRRSGSGPRRANAVAPDVGGKLRADESELGGTAEESVGVPFHPQCL